MPASFGAMTWLSADAASMNTFSAGWRTLTVSRKAATVAIETPTQSASVMGSVVGAVLHIIGHGIRFGRRFVSSSWACQGLEDFEESLQP